MTATPADPAALTAYPSDETVPSRDQEHASAARRVIRNALALSFARPFTWLSAAGLTVLLPGYLGDVNLGKINAAFAFADWCGLLVSLGITTYLTKEVARQKAKPGDLILNALVLRMALAFIVGLGAIGVAGLVTDDWLSRQLLYLLSIHMMLTVIGGVLTGALQGMQQMRSVATIDAFSKLALLSLVAIFLFEGFGVRSVAVAYIVSDLIAISCLIWAVKRIGGLAGSINLHSWKTLMTGGLPFFVWEVALLTYARVDVILLSALATSAVLGWYYAAYRIISLPLFLPVILMTAIFPALSASVHDSRLFNLLCRRGVVVAALTTVPLAFGLMLLADKVIDLFGYPASFSNSVAPIALLAAGLPLVAVNMIIAPALSALDRQRSWALLGVGAAVLNPLINLLAIPITDREFGNAAIGAAAVTTCTEIYLLAGGLILLPRGVLDGSTLAGVLKCLLAGLIMSTVLWLAKDFSIFVLVPIGALVYGLAVLFFRAVTLGELRQARAYLRGPVEV